MNKDQSDSFKKVTWFTFIVIIAFVIGLMIGGGNKTTTYQPKASENTVGTTSVGKPNLIGVVVGVQAVNNGNYAMVVSGINEPDYVTNSANKVPLQAKNYLVVVTPKTKVVKVTTGQVLTVNELKKDVQVAVATGTDLSTALQIGIK